jgi:hypothetical protein
METEIIAQDPPKSSVRELIAREVSSIEGKNLMDVIIDAPLHKGQKSLV